MKKCSEFRSATEWSPDDEVVEVEETGILSVREFGEMFGLTVHNLFSVPSDPDVNVRFIGTNINSVMRSS